MGKEQSLSWFMPHNYSVVLYSWQFKFFLFLWCFSRSTKKAIVSKTFITKNGCRNCYNLKRDNWYVFSGGVLPVFHLKLNAILLPRIVEINSQSENQAGPITKISSQKIQKNHPIQEIEPLQKETTAHGKSSSDPWKSSFGSQMSMDFPFSTASYNNSWDLQ